MTRHRMTNWIGMICAAVVLFGFAQTAAALGTEPDTLITNSASVSYEVDNQSRSASHEVSFKVDKKIDLLVEWQDGNYVSAPLGGAKAYLTFKVTNQGNAVQDFVLTYDEGTTNPVDSADDLTFVAPVERWVDDGDEVYNENLDKKIDYIDELASGSFIIVYLVANLTPDINSSDGDWIKDNDISAISLIATAHEGGSSGSQGTIETDNKAEDLPLTVQVVWADGDGDGNGDDLLDGQHSDTGAFKVQSAVLSIEKTYVISYDGMEDIAGQSNPKPIPGATITYKITVTNTGSLPVTGASVSDDLTGKIGVTIDWKGNLTTSAGTPNWNSPKVAVTGIDLNGGEQAIITFEVTIR